MRILRVGCTSVCLIWLVAWLTACETDARAALRFGASVWPGFEALHIAKARGKLDERLCRLIDFPSSVEVSRAYRNGVIDIAAVTADEALSLVALEPGRHRIFLVVDYSNGADSIVAQPEFGDWQQLRGRRIGVEANALGAYLLTRALELKAIAPTDVQIVNLPLEQQIAAFKSHTVDAMTTAEPRRSKLLALGAKEIFSSREIRGEVVDVLIARVELLKARRADLVQLTKTWFESVDFLRASPNEAASLAAAHEYVAPESFLISLQGVELLDRRANLQVLAGGEGSLAPSLQRLAKTMLDNELLPRAVETAELLDSSIVERAGP